MTLQAFGSSYFRGRSHFEDDGFQNNFSSKQFISILKRLLIAIIFQRGNQNDCLMKVLNILLHLIIVLLQGHINTKLRVKFDGHCSEQDKVTFMLNNL